MTYISQVGRCPSIGKGVTDARHQIKCDVRGNSLSEILVGAMISGWPALPAQQMCQPALPGPHMCQPAEQTCHRPRKSDNW